MKSTNVEDDARSDLRVRGLFTRGQNAYSDFSVVNPIADSHSNTQMNALLKKNERSKYREYMKRILEVEHGSFHPVVFSAEGHAGIGAQVLLKTLAMKLAEKRGEKLSQVITMIRVRLSFALRRSALLCLRAQGERLGLRKSG